MKINGIFHAYPCDDGSLMVEYYGPDWRIGIMIGQDTEDCGIYFVSSDDFDNHVLVNLFPPEILDCLVKTNAREKPYEIDRWSDDGGR